MDMVTLRPKASRRLPTLILAIAAALAAIIALLIATSDLRSFSGSLKGFAIGMATVAVVGAALVLEDKRMRTIELSHVGVTGLVWKRAAGLLPYRLTPLTLSWAEVKEVAYRGFTIGLKGSSGAILVNSYLFEKPDQVRAFISSHLTARGSGLDIR